MLTYSKALELKNAGFPQRSHYDGMGCSDFPSSHILDREHPEEWGVRISNPTLSELVDGCLERNHDLTFKLENSKDNILWWAEVWHFGMLIKQSEGSNAEEAVANLYLALHK